MIAIEQDARYGSLVGTYQRTAYLNLVAKCEVFARAVMYVDNFRKIKFLWAIFECVMIALEQEAMDLSF